MRQSRAETRAYTCHSCGSLSEPLMQGVRIDADITEDAPWGWWNELDDEEFDVIDFGPDLKVAQRKVGRIKGSSPSVDQYYVVMLFDISEPKKYRALVKILKSYGSRIQKSVFEAQLQNSQIKHLIFQVGQLMGSKRYFNEADRVRIYKIAGNCEVTVMGEDSEAAMEDDIFF